MFSSKKQQINQQKTSTNSKTKNLSGKSSSDTSDKVNLLIQPVNLC